MPEDRVLRLHSRQGVQVNARTDVAIFDPATDRAPQMMMHLDIAIKALLGATDIYLLHHAAIGKDLQVAVNGTKAHIG